MTAAIDMPVIDDLSRRLIDGFQRDLPLTPRPYAEIADQLEADEADVIDRLHQLIAEGVVSRVGPVFTPHRVGWSTLAAMAVPDDRLEDVAQLVSSYEEVNHNYEREHDFNLWFVVAAPSEARVAEVLDEIGARTGFEVLDLPLIEAYRLDLGFGLQWA